MIVARQSSRCIDKEKVIGYEHQVRSLKKELLRPGDNDRLKTIGIIGMAAIGKTTLCQLIFNDEEVKGFFLPRIWVCMSKRGDESEDEIVAVHKKMLVCLGVEEKIVHEVYDEYRLEGLSKALLLLLAGKRYLIVLDDAWDSSLPREGKWEDLACGLPKLCGGAVIVTSRNEELTKSIIGREGFLYRVPPLSDELCWYLFKREFVGPEQEAEQEHEKKIELKLKQELEQELGQKLKQELGQKLKQELEQKLKQELEQKLKQELEQKLKQELEQKLKQKLEQKLELCWPLLKKELDQHKNGEKAKELLKEEFKKVREWLKRVGEIDEAGKKKEADGAPNQNLPEKEKEKETDEAQKKKKEEIDEARNLKKKILELSAGIPLAAKLLAKSSTKMWAKNVMGNYVKIVQPKNVVSDENTLLKEFLDSFHDDNK